MLALFDEESGEQVQNQFSSSNETVAYNVVCSVFWRIFGLSQVARKFREQFFFFSKLFVRSRHLTRISRTRDASIHRDLFLGTGWWRATFGLFAPELGRFMVVSWWFWRPIAADGSAGPYVGKLRAAVNDCRQKSPRHLCRFRSCLSWLGLEHFWRGW